MSASKVRVTLTVLLTSVVLFPAMTVAATYGNPWNGDGLINLEIGRSNGRLISYRFRAQYSGTVNGVQIFLVFRTFCSGCYANGDGGQVLVRLQSDDGTSQHLPSGIVLTSSLVTDPLRQWNRYVAFNSPVQLTQGKLYHLVFSNPDPDPINNYVSIDDLYNDRRLPNMQPGISDTDLAVVWKSSSSSNWEVNYGHTPIFSLYYADGKRQGQGYTDALSSSGLRSIYGSNKVRETFTVSGGNKTVTQVSVRLKKSGSSGNLSVRLENADGTLIEGGTIPASSVSTSYAWVTYIFNTSRTLLSGKSYNLVLSAPYGDPYSIFPIQEGTLYGFQTPSVFTEGKFQSSSGSSWQEVRQGCDMQFYFTTR
jgi:hypothetical protein